MKVPKIKEMLVLLSPKIRYDYDRHIVWVVNHFRHQFMRTENISGKILEGARKCLISHRGHNFVADFLNLYKPLNLFTTDRPYPYPINTVLEGLVNPPGEGGGVGEGKDVVVEGGKGETKPPKIFALPEWIEESVWVAFEEMRKKAKKPMTDKARELIIRELENLKAKGHEPNAVLNQSVRKSWQDVYEIKNGGSYGSGNTGRAEKSGVKAGSDTTATGKYTGIGETIDQGKS